MRGTPKSERPGRALRTARAGRAEGRRTATPGSQNVTQFGRQFSVRRFVGSCSLVRKAARGPTVRTVRPTPTRGRCFACFVCFVGSCSLARSGVGGGGSEPTKMIAGLLFFRGR